MTTNLSIKAALMIFLVVFSAVFAALWLNRVTAGRSPVMNLSDGAAQASGTPPDFTDGAKRAVVSVVSIDSAVKYDTFGETLQRAGSGSGVVVQADGYIVTNAHVVRNPNERAVTKAADVVRVKTSDGRGYDAKVIGIDPRSDLAVIKIENANLIPATFVDSDSIDIGDWVIAVGNQLGFENSVSVGVVSSKNRWIDMENSSVLVDAIQTDATINMGNSGGALCNKSGEVVGINTSIATVDRVYAGVGFAVPSEYVTRVVNDLIEFGYVRYGVVGLELLDPRLSLSIPENRRWMARITDSEEPPAYGAIVNTVDPGTPAAKAGIKQFDVILEVDGRRINSHSDFHRATMEKQPGDQIEINVWSRGKMRTVPLTLAPKSK